MRATVTAAVLIVSAGLLVGCPGTKPSVGPLRYTTIHEAAAMGNIDDVKRHLERGAAVNERAGPGNATPLHCAVGAGQTKVVEFLIANGADVNAVAGMLGAGFSTSLEIAAEEGHVDIVKLLILKGADLAEYGSGAIGLALDNEHNEIAELLIDAGAVPDDRLLVTPVDKGDTEIVRLLVKGGADVNYMSESGWHGNERCGTTLLHDAIRGGHVEIVKLLIEKGVDINMKNLGGGTPLFIAVQRSQPARRGEIIDLFDDRPGRDAAYMNDCAEITELLREHGAE